tara:strand:- start:824 stop:1321 length:498 start_codon:yes stop_codon:yes gene_type:complete
MTLMKHYKNQVLQISKGFSLIELIVIMTLLGILAALASTRIKDISVNVRVSAATNQITSDIELIKETALANHENMSITYNLEQNNYTIRKNGSIMTDYPGSDSGIINLSEGMFSGVDITQVNINGSNVINFDKWGNVLNNGTITLNQNHIISINKLTGFTEISIQ